MILASFNRRAENVLIHAVIVAELELRDIQRQVLLADLVEGADDATLKDRPEPFNRVRVDRTDDVLPRTVANELVREVLGEVPVAGMFVGGEKAHLVRNSLANEAIERGGIGVLNHAGDDVALALHGSDNDELVRSLTANAVAFLIPMAVLVLAADERLIDLDNAAKFHFRLDKRGADFVAHAPCGFVRTEAHDALDLKGAHSLLAGQHQMHNAEPLAQRLIRVLENRPGDDRETVALRGAILALPMPRARLQLIDLGVAAAWAGDFLRPAPRLQVALAIFLSDEHRLELRDRHLMNRLGAASGHRKLPSMEGYFHA